MRYTTPLIRPGQSIGLLGGSFDPPHAGHVHISLEAMKRFGLDRLWWLVSPGNPLKVNGPAPMDKRLAASREIMTHPRVDVTDIEAQMGTRYTAETLQKLRARYPATRFVWLMGSDNMVQFPKWERWDWIMENVPVGVMARPGQRLSARMSKAADRYGRWRVPAYESHKLPHCAPPAWCFINIPMSNISSTAIRASGGWG